MYLQIFKNRDQEYVRIAESYRDPETKKPKIRVIQNFGNKEKLLAENPNAIEELQKKVDQMNLEKEHTEVSMATQRVSAFIEHASAQPSDAGAPVQNYGYEVYQWLWDQLKLDSFLQYRQKKETNIHFPTKTPIALMVYSRLLFPGSKRSTFEGKDRFASEFPCELEQMYRALPFLASQKNQLEEHLNKQISQFFDRNLSVAFYDVTTYYFESVKADDLKKFGYSKDNKVNQVQVVMGLLIDDKAFRSAMNYSLETPMISRLWSLYSYD